MRAGLIVVLHVRQQHVSKVTLAKHNDMVESFPPDRANQPFSICVLPWRSRRSWPVTYAHRAKPPDEHCTINAVTIANDISRWTPPAASLRKLSGDPFGGRVRGRSQPQDSAPAMLQNEQAVQQSK